MKKYQLILIGACFMLMTACGAKNGSETANVPKNTNASSSSIQGSGNVASTTIEDMVSYFKEKGLSFPKIANIEKIDFAAYEGKVLENNGQKAYLYRLNSQDSAMKKLMQQVREKGVANVKIDNEHKQYSAMVNGDYLLLYDQGANMSNITSVFPNFQEANVKKDTQEVNADASSSNTPAPNTEEEPKE